MERKEFGMFITSLRKENGMTQREAAEKLNVSNKTVSKWECGEGYPEVSMLPALAQLYHVSVDELLRGRKEESLKEPGGEGTQLLQLEKAMLGYRNRTVVCISLMLLAFFLFFLFQTNFLTSVWPIYKNRQVLGSCGPAALALLLQVMGVNRVLSSLDRLRGAVDEQRLSNAYQRVFRSLLGLLYLVLLLVSGDVFTVFEIAHPVAVFFFAFLLPAVICLLLSIPVKKHWFSRAAGTVEAQRTRRFHKKLIRFALVSAVVVFAAIAVPWITVWAVTEYRTPAVYTFESRGDYEASKAAFEKSESRLLFINPPHSAISVSYFQDKPESMTYMQGQDAPSFQEVIATELESMERYADCVPLKCVFQDDSGTVSVWQPFTVKALLATMETIWVVWFDVTAVLTGVYAVVVWKKENEAALAEKVIPA